MADISVDDIQGMIDNTLDLQNKAAQMLGDAKNATRIKVFDPRCEADIQGSEDNAVVWTTKSVDLAYEAIKNGYSLKKSPFYRGDLDLRKANLTFQYTQEELEEIIKCKNDIVYFANKYVYLKTATGYRHIKLRPYQIKLLKQVQDNRFTLELCARQTGKTTTTSIMIAWYVCFHVDKTVAIIANKESIASEVFGKVKSVIRWLPFFMKPGCYKFGNSSFELDNGCRGLFRTAQIDAIQGFTIDFMFIDEFAYIKNTKAREFWVNVYPTISSIPDAKIVIASTPNGRNLFWELWNGAVTKKNRFVPFRVDYWMVPGRDEAWVEQEKANIGEEGFAQQYALSFDTKMKSILSADTFQFLNKVEQQFESGLLPIGTKYDEYFSWSTMFKYSLKKDWFFLSIDIGEGLNQDFSVIRIYKLVKSIAITKLVNVGVFHCDTIQISDFAEVLVQLCRKMNMDQTRIVIERNTYGDLFMLQIENIEEHSHDGFEIPLESYAKFARREGYKLEKGLRLNAQNKKVGVAAYKELINAQRIIETDQGTIAEIREFGETDSGTFKASVGHDDLVMPIVNLSYYLKSASTALKEFFEEFNDSTSIDLYNVKVLVDLKMNAEVRIKREKTDIIEDNEPESVNEYSEVSPVDEELALYGPSKEQREKLAKESDDEYALANKILATKKNTKSKDTKDLQDLV